MPERLPAETELLWDEFHQVVNMTSDELRAWLLTAASGDDALPDQSGLGIPELGLQVIDLLRKRKTDLTEADTETMRQVVEFVEDQSERRPTSVEPDDAWRHELMNVGHDPLKALRES